MWSCRGLCRGVTIIPMVLSVGVSTRGLVPVCLSLSLDISELAGHRSEAQEQLAVRFEWNDRTEEKVRCKKFARERP